MSIEIKIESEKRGWDLAMNFCNNLCVEVSDEHNNNDRIEEAIVAEQCIKKIKANMGFYPPEITEQLGCPFDEPNTFNPLNKAL